MTDVHALTPALFPALHDLFAGASSSCFCRYWHFTGNKNEWLDRCAHRPEENAAELRGAIGTAEGRGLVALRDGRAVGWMKLTARIAVPKLRRLPVYRSLDLGDEETTFAIGCFLVHPTARRQGVARALVEAAPRFAREWGAKAIEAYPRRSAAPLYDEEAWQGPEGLFTGVDGWFRAHDVGPYPVWRLLL